MINLYNEGFKHSNFDPLLHEIKNLVSCENPLFTMLYVETVKRYCLANQKWIDGNNHVESVDKNILKPMQLAIAALKIRRGIFFPKNAAASTIALEEPQWTYALFTAALYQNSVSNIDQEKQSKECFSSKIAIDQCVPKEALEWLKTNKYLFDEWQSALGTNSDLENEIIILIDEAKKKLKYSKVSIENKPIDTIDIRYGKEDQEAAPLVVKHNHIDSFIQAVDRYFSQYPDRVFRIKEGVFIESSLMNEIIAESKEAVEDLLVALTQAGYLILYEESFYHYCSSKHFEDQQVLKGIVIDKEYCPDSLKALPIHSKYHANVQI